jgi:ABC-type transport system substrate-binding protein
MAIDRPGILGALDGPMGTGGGSGLTHVSQYAQFWVDPINDAATFGENAQYFQHNVSAAQDLLGEAGYGSGIDLTAVTSSVYGAGYLSQMQAVAASAEEAGFRSQINQQEYGAYISTTFFGELAENEFGLAPLMGSPMDPHNIFFTIFHPSSARHNYGPHGDPHGIPADQLPVAGDEGPSGDAEMLSMFSAQAEELDFDARVQMIHEIQNYLAGQMYFVPWTGVSTAYAFAPYVKGIQLIRGYGYGAEVAPNIWLDV